MKFWPVLFVSLLFGACAVSPVPGAIWREDICAAQNVVVDANFSASGMSACRVEDDKTVTISIVPEDPKINPSPWYAVRVDPSENISPRLVLEYQGAKHRYAPKISDDGANWTLLPPSSVAVDDAETRVVIDLPASPQPYFVAAQELVDNDNYGDWIQGFADRNDVEIRQIGTSVQGRPIEMLRTRGQSAEHKTVFLVGRQHPPEVTGALAMRTFNETVLGDTPLAIAFREVFDLAIIPIMNPDGVELGHWRHNTGGVDLNRDWGPFTQVETQSVKSVFDEMDADPANKLVLFLDFHSTRRNVFYTQTVEDEPTSYDFTSQWMDNARARLTDYDFERAERHNSDLPTSKNYMFSRFAIPAITYEIGDNTDRSAIRQSSIVFAEEMMKLLLAHE